jgi:hypothetical protein
VELRVAVDIVDKRGEVPLILDKLAVERFFEQAAGVVVSFVDSLGVGAEKVGEG